MKFNLAKMLILIASVVILIEAASAATPISLTVWEKSSNSPLPKDYVFAWNDARLTAPLSNPPSNGNSDFQTPDNEYYDLIRWSPPGGPIDASELYIIGTTSAAGFNIARVDIKMSNNTTYYFSLAMGSPEDDLSTTWTTFGNVYSYVDFTEPKVLNPPLSICCPPWNQAKLAELMVYKPGSLFPITYSLSFQPTIAFKREMQSYIEHLNALDPTITMIIIDWTLYDQGTGAVPMGWASGSSPGNNGTKIGPNYFRTWQANGASTSIDPINPIPAFFPGLPMQMNRWYMIHTGIYLNNDKKFFADSCANNDIYVRVRPKIGGGRIFEVRDANNNLLDQ